MIAKLSLRSSIGLCVAVVVGGLAAAFLMTPRQEFAAARAVDAETRDWLANNELPQDFDPNRWLLPGVELVGDEPESASVAAGE